MSGIKYLLDTNYILGLLKMQVDVLAVINTRGVLTAECAYSGITRVELLGFPSIQPAEEKIIREKLELMTYLPLNREIEDVAINLRRTRKVKLPDALIASTALCTGLELLTLDQHLQSVVGVNALVI